MYFVLQCYCSHSANVECSSPPSTALCRMEVNQFCYNKNVVAFMEHCECVTWYHQNVAQSKTENIASVWGYVVCWCAVCGYKTSVFEGVLHRCNVM